MLLRIFIHMIFIVFLLQHANAQEKVTKKRMYKTWVKKTDRSSRLIGALYEVQDTKLLISNSLKLKDYDLDQFEYQDVYAHEIEKIKLRRKGNVGRGILIGVVSGLVTGAIIGKIVDFDDHRCTPPAPVPSTISSGINSILGLYGLGFGADDYHNIYMRQQYLYNICEASWQPGKEKALQYGFMGGLAGGIVGALLGSLKIKIPINGSESKFRANLPRLISYSYQRVPLYMLKTNFHSLEADTF